MINATSGVLNSRMITDAVNPSPAGFESILSQCWGPAIGQMLGLGGGPGQTVSDRPRW